MIHYAETKYGFDYGAAQVDRICSDEKKGWVLLGIKTPKDSIQVYVTKTGKVRVYRCGGGELLEKKALPGVGGRAFSHHRLT